MDSAEITALVAAAGAAGAGLLKAWDAFTSKDQRRANARATEQGTALAEVAMLREIIGDVRASEAKKVERIDNLERRLDLLEERERHMLTRAAVHEAWDQMAFAVLCQLNPEHPPPPPLTDGDFSHHFHPPTTPDQGSTPA